MKELEARWQADRIDYPLFPGSRIRDKREHVVGVGQPGSDKPANPKALLNWFRDAEERAGVEHVHSRGFHGIRRTVSDLLYEELGLGGLTVAMGWSSQATPEQIYLDSTRMRERVRAREAMERRRRGGDEDDAKP